MMQRDWLVFLLSVPLPVSLFIVRVAVRGDRVEGFVLERKRVSDDWELMLGVLGHDGWRFVAFPHNVIQLPGIDAPAFRYVVQRCL